jgi:hypothetical protein
LSELEAVAGVEDAAGAGAAGVDEVSVLLLDLDDEPLLSLADFGLALP